MPQSGKGPHDYLELGTWNVACSMCGRKRKAHSVEKNWQGQYRCPEHNETRHPQDFVRAVPDDMSVPYSQPETDAFVGICFPNNTMGIAGWGVAGCMVADYINPFFNPSITEN